MPDDDLPREPDPPARATDVDKQDPATPDHIPEPEASEVESARLLANQARPELGAEGFSDQRIDELASEFIASDIGEGLEEFLRWARVEGQLPAGLRRALLTSARAAPVRGGGVDGRLSGVAGAATTRPVRACLPPPHPESPPRPEEPSDAAPSAAAGIAGSGR